MVNFLMWLFRVKNPITFSFKLSAKCSIGIFEDIILKFPRKTFTVIFLSFFSASWGGYRDFKEGGSSMSADEEKARFYMV